MRLSAKSRFFEVAVLLCTLFLAGCESHDSSQTWQEFKSEKCQFSAQFPGTVQVDDVGTISQFQAAGEVANFRITCALVPPLKDHEAALRELLDMRDGAAKSLSATVEEARKADFQGQPTIDFTITFSVNGEKMISHSRYIRFPNRLYQLIVTSPAPTNAEPDVRQFFDSLQVETK